MASCKWNQLGARFILSIFITLYIFRATMCPSSPTTFMCRLSRNLGVLASWKPVGLFKPVMGQLFMCPSLGETAVFVRHLVLVILCGWLSGMQGGMNDDGPIVAWNTWRLINILRINCAPSWFCLQDCTEIHGQQNVQNRWLHESRNMYLLCSFN